MTMPIRCWTAATKARLCSGRSTHSMKPWPPTRLGSGISRSPVARYEAESPPNHMMGRKASITRTRSATAPASTRPNSQCSVFPLTFGRLLRRLLAVVAACGGGPSSLVPRSSVQSPSAPFGSREGATCQYLAYGTGPFAHRRRAPCAAAASALEDADPPGAGRGAGGGGRAGGGGGDPVRLGGGGGATGGGRGRDPGPHAGADGAGAALADDDL